MRASDLSRVEAIYRQLTDRAPPAAWVETARRALDDTSGEPLAWVACDEASKEVLGYAVGEVRPWEFGSEPAGWVIGLATDVTHRHQGVGQCLLERLQHAFAERQVTTIRTMVRRDDVAVLRFFRSAGFTSGPYTELEMPLEVSP
jgi:ribosomal protein S18 acetylase RimI-like enzyme